MQRDETVPDNWSQLSVGDTFRVSVPHDWNDITELLDDIPNVPWTLAATDGNGALQFSIALYKRGPRPNPSAAVLLEMLQDYAAARNTGPLASIVIEAGPPVLAAATMASEAEPFRVWYLSKGGNFAFVTYTAGSPLDERELHICERIVRSLEFESNGIAAEN